MTDEEIKDYWRTAYCNEKHKKEQLEKQIQIDAEQIRALQKQNGELTDRVKELQADNDARKFAMAMSEKVEKQLREQIEKMKCCKNCKYRYCGRSSISIDKDENRTFHNWNKEKQEYCDVGRNGKYQCWELAE